MAHGLQRLRAAFGDCVGFGSPAERSLARSREGAKGAKGMGLR